jgi:tRNA (cytidine/uridine-2'-O-)-methyltransferase
MTAIVLFRPEIPGNTGSIGRTCVALNIPLILIGPYGFEISEKSVRRAGLDYWKFLNLKEYQNWHDFIQGEKIESPDNLFFFENQASPSYFDAPFSKDSYLIFGGETKGLSSELWKEYSSQFYQVPMNSIHIRSLNLSNVATAVVYECLRKNQFVFSSSVSS